MALYEQTLSKISPVFYKFARYEYYFLYFNDLLHQYKKRANIPLEFPFVPNEFICQTKDVYYCYNSGYDSFLINGTKNFLFKIMLNRSYKMETFYGYVNFSAVIVNTVINKFIFENKRIKCCFKRYDYIFKDLFIALVGKDTYETIRTNIK